MMKYGENEVRQVGRRRGRCMISDGGSSLEIMHVEGR